MTKRTWVKENPKEKIKRKKRKRKQDLRKKIWKKIARKWTNEKKLGRTSFTYLIISCGWKHEKKVNCTKVNVLSKDYIFHVVVLY
jgi:hypothetical protein